MIEWVIRCNGWELEMEVNTSIPLLELYQDWLFVVQYVQCVKFCMVTTFSYGYIEQNI